MMERKDDYLDPPFFQQMVSGLVDKVRRGFDDHLRDSVRKRLGEMGYAFETHDEFMAFVKNELIDCQYEEKPWYHELRVRRTYDVVLTFSNELNVSFDDNTVNISIG